MTVVLDSSALITLARIGRLELLHRILGAVHVPQAVFDEVVVTGAGRPGSATVAEAPWVRRHSIRDAESVARLRTRLGPGEAEAIVLAKELGADLVVIDDARARQVAEAEGQHTVGLLGLLLYGKEAGLISEVKPLLDEMLAAGFFLDDSRYQAFLRRASE